MNHQEFHQQKVEKIKQIGEEMGFEMPLFGEKDLPEFEQLRERLKSISMLEVIVRRASNPTPDQEEISAGAYREEIEPQCREAIFTIRRKGYNTGSSGFAIGNLQNVDGNFDLTEKDLELLKENNFFVWKYKTDETWVIRSIVFRPKNPDLQEITDKWNQLAELLPDLGHPAPSHTKSEAGFHKMFRTNHKGDTINILLPKLYNYKNS